MVYCLETIISNNTPHTANLTFPMKTIRALRRLLPALALPALACCTHQDAAIPVSQVPIHFETPIVAPVTRAGESYTLPEGQAKPNNQPYPTNWKFCVSAVKHTGDFAGWPADPADVSLYIDHACCEYYSALNGWRVARTPGVNYYWPYEPDAKLTFQALSPYAWHLPACATIGPNGVTCTNYQLQTDGTQPDLMYSSRTTNQSATQITTSPTPSYNGAQLQFHHALSSLCFRAKLDDAYNGWRFAITRIQLRDVKVRGDFSQGLTPEATSGGNPLWTPNGEVLHDYDNVVDHEQAPNGIEVTVYGEEEAELLPNVKSLLVMPQEIASTTRLEVDYVFARTQDGVLVDENEIYHQTQVVNLHSLISVSQTGEAAFRCGRQYIFDLVISRTRIRFLPVMGSDTWVESQVEVQNDEGQEAPTPSPSL